MAIKKNAAKANIGPKKQVKATFAECTAVNKLKCRYHGLKALDSLIGNVLASTGHPSPFVTEKHADEYELRLPSTLDLSKNDFAKIVYALHKEGFSIFNKGQLENGAWQYKIKPSDGSGFESPEGEAEIEEGEILSSTDAPENNTVSNEKKDPFAELEDIDVESLIEENELDADLLDNFDDLEDIDEEATEDLEAELLGNTEFDDEIFSEMSDEDQASAMLTDADIKNLVSFKGVTDDHFEQNPDLMDNYKAILTTGKNPNGAELNQNQKEWWNDLLEKVKTVDPLALPALTVLQNTMKKVNENQGDASPKPPFTDAELDDWIKKLGGAESLSSSSPENFAAMKEQIMTATVNGEPITKATMEDLKAKALAVGNLHPVSKFIMENFSDGSEQSEASDNGDDAEMLKCKSKWNNLMTTAIVVKNLKGTQHWAENIQPIIEDYNDAIAANDVVKAFDAVYDLKNAVKDAPDLSDAKPTIESLKADMAKSIEHLYATGMNLTWDAKKGMTIGGEFETAINANDVDGASKALQKFNDYLQSLENGDEVLSESEEQLTADDIKDFFQKCGFTEGIMLLEDNLAATKEALETGKFKGKTLTTGNKKWYAELAKKAPDHKVAKAINEMLSADKMKPKKIKKGSAKEILSAALGGSSDPMVAEGMLKPLEHNESNFPQNLTKDELDKAIKVGKKLGGHGGLGTRLVEIGGKQYVCKAASGTGASVIKNGFNADMAYRAGGVYAPDAKLYDFGDGKVYKLSEFIPGKRLIDVWKTADEATRDGIRKELLKGYPLDVLFSNYDVLGTSPEDTVTVMIQGADGKPQKTHVAFNNIMIGDDGHAYRVDNDGSFAMTGTGGIKTSSGGGYITKVEAEKWGNWEDRQWIDDFRTMRRNEKNLGIFDRYSTADIFLSAGNINLDAVVGTLPQGIQKALAKPLFEMKQMTWRAVNMALGGYKNNEFVSMALDASYEASKRGLRELSAKSVSWNDSGFGEYKSYWGNYSPQPFGENPPEKPQDPTTALADKLKNEEYTGSKIGSIIFSAAKTINYHGGEKKFDEKGNPIGNPMSNPDYKPNAAKIADWEKIDRDKLAELAKTDANAKILLGLYDTIAYSKENGWKKPIGLVPSGLTIQGKLAKDYLSPTEKKIHDDMAGAIAEYKAKMSVYQKELAEYEKRKDAHKKKEEEKAKAAGGSPYHNFHDFAKALMEEGIDTNGIAHRVQTNGIAPIESSMGAQKGSSYADSAVRWKVREMMALGFTPEQILEMADQKKLYKGSYYTSCINSYLLPHKEEWDRDMASQAMYLGMNMVKMENEHNDLYDKKSGVVFLNRNIGNIPQGLTAEEKKIYSTSSTTGWVGPHVDSAADCMQFEANWWHEPYKQVYAVPLSRIVCCANNDMATGGGYGYGSEQEYVGNLYNLPCWVYHDDQNLTWKGAIDEANKTSGMKGFLKKLASRLGFFSTHPKK